MTLLDNMFSIVDDGQAVRIRLHPEHPIYQAHFPGNPITPGVCIVQIIIEVLQKKTARHLELAGITNLKFVQPISPVETPEVDLVFNEINQTADGQCRTKGVVCCNETIYTKFSIICQ